MRIARQRKKSILLTGFPGAGKTTLLDHLLTEYPNQTIGIVSREIRNVRGQRIGFRAIDVRGNWEKVFASVDLFANSPARVGRYGIDLQALDAIADRLLQLCNQAEQEKTVLIFDEIGLMELSSQKLVAAINCVLQADAPTIMTVGVRPLLAQPRLLLKGRLLFLRGDRSNTDSLNKKLAQFVQESLQV